MTTAENGQMNRVVRGEVSRLILETFT